MTIRRVLGLRLQELRKAAGCSVEDAAGSVGVPARWLIQVEAGHARLDLLQLIQLIKLYGVADHAERTILVCLGQQERMAGWWRGFGDVVPEWLARYLEVEQVAVSILSYDPLAVPSLLQTADYARAVLGIWYSGADLSRRVELLMRRQEIVHGEGVPALWAIIDEGVLRRPCGGVGVMRAQLQRLATLAELEHVTIQVCPLAAAAQAPAGGPITLLRMPGDLPDVVHLEHAAGGDFPENVDYYRSELDRAAHCAARPPEETADLLAAIGKDLVNKP